LSGDLVLTDKPFNHSLSTIFKSTLDNSIVVDLSRSEISVATRGELSTVDTVATVMISSHAIVTAGEVIEDSDVAVEKSTVSTNEISTENVVDTVSSVSVPSSIQFADGIEGERDLALGNGSLDDSIHGVSVSRSGVRVILNLGKGQRSVATVGIDSCVGAIGGIGGVIGGVINDCDVLLEDSEGWIGLGDSE
jgi:hypothetical protein